jgi:acyl carrier protein
MLTREVATILAVQPDDLKGRTVGFFEMGMDSIMTVELKRRLEVALDCKLPTTVAFEYPTIDRMSDFIASDVLLLEAESQSEPDSRTVRDSDNDDLNELSDEDLREMLDAELAVQAAGDE